MSKLKKLSGTYKLFFKSILHLNEYNEFAIY